MLGTSTTGDDVYIYKYMYAMLVTEYVHIVPAFNTIREYKYNLVCKFLALSLFYISQLWLHLCVQLDANKLQLSKIHLDSQNSSSTFKKKKNTRLTFDL